MSAFGNWLNTMLAIQEATAQGDVACQLRSSMGRDGIIELGTAGTGG